MNNRQSGILMHVSSLPNAYGIGSLGQAAYDFIDFLAETGQSYWQVLPLGPTSYGDSPYQSFSAFAGNTYFIDLDILIADGLLTREEVDAVHFGDQPDQVDYANLFDVWRPLMEKAVARFKRNPNLTAYGLFLSQHEAWLEDFALYMAIKEHFDNRSWLEWPDENIRQRLPESLAYYQQLLADAVDYHRITQYLFFKQWEGVRAYANHKDIKIIGDMPIYVSADSSDMWKAPHYFKTDEAGRPSLVAGCPPDAFSDTGQLWGNPIYDWEVMAGDHYAWWRHRLREAFRLFDVVRIDHFRGFEAYWEIPVEEDTAINGKWVKGPDRALFAAFEEEFGTGLPIIAEDLGLITDEVLVLRDQAGLPGMKVLQFAFDSEGDNTYLPHHCPYNTVIYTGTHDNNTVRGWYEEEISETTRSFFEQYSHQFPDETASQAMIRLAWASNSYLAITSMQDLLNLGGETRMNTPSTQGNNWKWRMKSGIINPCVIDHLSYITKLYLRQKEQQ